jgi:hypothetical protein
LFIETVLWTLSFVPIWVIHATLFAGVGLFVITTIASHIPFIKTYAMILRLISIIAIVIGIYLEGALGFIQQHKKAMDELNAKIKVAEQQADDANKKIKTKIVETVKIIKDTTNANVQAIREYGSDNCKLSNVGIVLHDVASQNQVPPSTIGTIRGTSDVETNKLIETAIENYGTCYEMREKLRAWQDWYKTQKDIYESVK